MTAFAAFAVCLLTTRVRLVQVQLLATLAAAVGAFYIEYEDAPRGYRHLRLELRVLVCRVSGAEVVEGSGGVAIAFLCYWGFGAGAVRDRP